MKKLVGIFAFLLPALLSAQSAMQWQQIYGGPGVEAGYSVKTCMSPGYIFAGTSSTLGPSDGYVVRTDTLGLVMWQKFYGGVNIDVIRAIETLPDSGFILAGYTNSYGAGGYDGWVLRINKYGDTLWTKTLGTSDWDFFYSVTPTFDSGFVFAGGTYGMGNGDEDMWFVKLDSVGNEVWDTTWGGAKMDEARCVIELSDSMLVATGVTYSLSDTTGDGWILNLDYTDGDTNWTRTTFYHSGNDVCLGASDYPQPGWIYYCGKRETTPGNFDAVWGIMSYNGDSLYHSFTGGPATESFNAIVTRPDGLVAMIGVNHTVGAGGGDMYMFHTATWQSFTYGTAQLDEGYDMDVTPGKGYIVVGSTLGFGSYQDNVYLIKIDSLGISPNILDVHEEGHAPAGTTTSVFPNPTGGNVYFNYNSANGISGDISLKFYDVTGQLVLSIAPAEWIQYSAQQAECTIDLSVLSAGSYYYSLEEGANSTSGKIFIVH